MTIWKYELVNLGKNVIDAPVGCKPIYFGQQNTQLCVWCIVNPTNPKVPYVFHVVGTGFDVPEGNYLGTAQVGRYVWHCFAV